MWRALVEFQLRLSAQRAIASPLVRNGKNTHVQGAVHKEKEGDEPSPMSAGGTCTWYALSKQVAVLCNIFLHYTAHAFNASTGDTGMKYQVMVCRWKLQPTLKWSPLR